MTVAVPGAADERRRGRRIPLRWQLNLIRADGSVLATTTENISSSGLLCNTSERLVTGEEVDCHLTVPPKHLSSSYSRVRLICRVRVVRVEPCGPGHYASGCRIEDYKLIAE